MGVRVVFSVVVLPLISSVDKLSVSVCGYCL